MKKGSQIETTLDRRQALALLGSAGVALIAGCGGTDDAGSGGSGGSGAGGGSTAGGWALGGTAAMSGDYADPFTDPLGSACTLICATTLGPCYAETIERRDISEGYPGLPVRLALLVVDESCTPVEGATVDIWHTRNSGLYSGPDAAAMCTGEDDDAMTHRFFRGVQTTDANGRVDFDTCYPGWYPGRCIHIHFTVRVGGQEYVTSQLFFRDELTAEVFAEHPDYAEFGQPDTTNATDSIYGGEDYIVSAAQQADGALLAWKTLVIRSSLSTALCGSSGGPPAP